MRPCEMPDNGTGLNGALRLLPEAAALWRRPLGLGGSLRDLVRDRTSSDLQSALRSLGERAPTRKADAAERLVAVLSDRDRVRRLVDAAPADVAQRLRRAASGRPTLLDAFQGFWPHSSRNHPLAWAVDRMLLVPTGWYGELIMPAEVALALRGPQWHAPFDPLPPQLAWSPNAVELVQRESSVAAAHALRTVAAVLQQVGATPMPLLKSGAVGVRELRRVAKLVGCEPGEVRFTLALALWAEMIGLDEDRITPTVGFDAWLAADPARRLADLVNAWVALPESPMAEPTAAWQPDTDPATTALRVHVLAEMARHPGGAPLSVAALAEWGLWQVPVCHAAVFDGALDLCGDETEVDGDLNDLFGDRPDGADPAVPSARQEALARVRVTLSGILAEAAWLGLTGAGALSASGEAVIAGDDVAGVAESGLGTVHQTARLQGDLTAVVLGHPSPRLAEVLDQLADRESRSTAGSWRFSPASIRRAMDAGLDETTIQQMLVTVAEGEVPQPLSYLVGDVARRHGRLRVGELASYLRCEDDALLTELLADRSLRRLGLRRIAPGVVGAGTAAATVLGTLRAAGYLPVAEDAAGTVMLERPQTKRVRTVPDPGWSIDPEVTEFLSVPADPAEQDDTFDVHRVAATLMDGPDHLEHEAPDRGADVIDMADFEELMRRRGDEDV